MFSESLERVIGECYQAARDARREFMGVEDLLLHLLSDQEVQKAIIASRGELQDLVGTLTTYLNEHAKVRPEGDLGDTLPTLEFQRVLQRAVYHVQSSGRKEVKPVNCLVATFGEKDSYAVRALNKHGVQRLDVVNFVSDNLTKAPPLGAFERIERIKDNVPAIKPIKRSTLPKLRVFISYSHRDATCLERLLIHLRPLEKRNKIDSWSDNKIRPGDNWKREIASQIEQAAVAVLLLSADFLASDFIVDHELPPLLINAEANGTRIIPVVLKPCGVLRDELLKSFQCINDPRHPLLGLSAIDQEHLYDKIAGEIHKELQLRES